jgi:hypothetical protein
MSPLPGQAARTPACGSRRLQPLVTGAAGAAPRDTPSRQFARVSLVRWPPGPNCMLSRREAVAALDDLIGPKR